MIIEKEEIKFLKYDKALDEISLNLALNVHEYMNKQDQSGH